MFRSSRNFKTRYVLAIKYISASNEILKLWLNIQIFLSSNKIQLLPKQKKQQFKYYFAKNLNARQDYIILFYILHLLTKNMGNMHSSLANQIFHFFGKDF